MFFLLFVSDSGEGTKLCRQVAKVVNRNFYNNTDAHYTRVRKVALFSVSLNLDLLFCEIFYCKE